MVRPPGRGRVVALVLTLLLVASDFLDAEAGAAAAAQAAEAARAAERRRQTAVVALGVLARARNSASRRTRRPNLPRNNGESGLAYILTWPDEAL